MASLNKTGNLAYDQTITQAYGVYQVAMAGQPSAATVLAAETAYYQAVIAAAQANGMQGVAAWSQQAISTIGRHA